MNLTNSSDLIDTMNIINIPKKRGRKPKIINHDQTNISNTLDQTNILNTSDQTNISNTLNQINISNTLDQTNILNTSDQTNMSNTLDQTNLKTEQKKRGRKPKIKTEQMTKKKITKKKDIIQSNVTKEMNVDLSKVLDFTTDDVLLENQTNQENIVSNIWLNKYQPKNLKEIIGNKDQITKIRKWLANFDNHQNHTVIISGAHGVGKNIITKLALMEAGYQIKNIHSTTLKNKNIVSEIIHSCAKSNNVYTSYNKTIFQKYAVVIDDTESMTLTSEKDNLTELFKLNKQNKYFPLILISNLQHSKYVDNFKKQSLNIEIIPPNINLIKNYVKLICEKEHINIANENIIVQIIKFCQSDIRRLIFLLQDISCTYFDKIIDANVFKEYQSMSQKKDKDVGLYYATKYLLDGYKNVNKCLELYDTEKVLLPLTIYENYYRKLFKQKLSNITLIDVMTNITNSASIGDVIETNIYSDQNWFLQTIHGFYTCADTSYIMNIANIEHNSNVSKSESIEYDLEFSADFNKTSSKNINKKKNILTLQTKFKNKNINDVLFINKIFFELENSNSHKTIKRIKDTYNLNSKNVQTALKIDKTNEKTNVKITGKKNKKKSTNFDEINDTYDVNDVNNICDDNNIYDDNIYDITDTYDDNEINYDICKNDINNINDSNDIF